MATNEQLYDRAVILIEGDSNIKANPKKGWKQMKELADTGYDKACIMYAQYLCDLGGGKNLLAARDYYEKIKLTSNSDIKDYALCLYSCAAAKKKDAAYIKGCAEALGKYEGNLFGDARYCYAMLLKASDPSQTKKIEENLYYAALGGSDLMPDSEYEAIGRERGVLSTKSEMDAWLKVASDASYAKFIPCEKSEEDAWFYASENLEAKETKKILSGTEIKKLLESHPKGTLEYQPLIRMSYNCGLCNFGYEYDNPKYSTVSTGSGKYSVDTHWTHCCATFKTKLKQNELWKQYMNAKTTDKFVDARVRTSPYGYSEVIDLCSDMSLDSTKKGSREKVREYVAKEFNYDKKYVKININSWDIKLYSTELVFVPFYFFTYSFSKTKSVTVRVNAFTCEVDYFENNPFGQFNEDDDITAGGAGETEKVRNRKKKNSKKAKKRRKSFGSRILNRIVRGAIALEIVLIIVGFAADVTALGVVGIVALVLTLGLIIKKKFF